ncbi:unnamed protein product [Acanthoscelides obtectus]|uniref:Uncharacterized protein n=1 Tax=Acanthoscelides obtectus TaxID=200917 RepID=A0A9P0PZV5_ACAOB|nr:unnamed protein product [Acanthoscelides obtectus]CAK1646629.1 Histone-lysine N-methyltransferase SETMAR [Acanthoscelides obtectus]
MPGKRLDGVARDMVVKLLKYFDREKRNNGPLLPVDAIQERVSHAMGISMRTVSRIFRESKENRKPVDQEDQAASKTKKYKPREKTKTADLPDAVKMEVKNAIYNMYSESTPKNKQYLTEENVELLEYPPYSPDLRPNDFFTFPKIKNRLRGQRFQPPEEAVDAFKNAVSDLPANEWNTCFENWFEAHDVY